MGLSQFKGLSKLVKIKHTRPPEGKIFPKLSVSIFCRFNFYLIFRILNYFLIKKFETLRDFQFHRIYCVK